MRGSLVLEDGTIVAGRAFGFPKTVYGELVFNTNMTGYCEALTDPSYRGQILMMTYPLIGNYGVDPETFESGGLQVTAFVVREACFQPSHARSHYGLDRLLQDAGIPGLEGVDTRQLTKKTRSRGTMRAAVVAEDGDVQEVLKEVRRMPFPDVARNLVAEVSCRETIVHRGKGDKRFVVVDCGLKMNIVREALPFGEVIQVPWDTPAEAILAHRPHGVIVSNGPGNPSHPDVVAATVHTCEELSGRVPLFGICLGHQILALAHGAKTYKLKFGHRGGNQPVKDIVSGRVHITSQNHGFTVEAESLPSEFEVTHLNLNDNTVEGVRHKRLPIHSVQYHPEASPGPKDNEYLFAEFARNAGR